MSQSAWIRGPVCGIDNCRSRLYKSYAGRKICQYGHVVEGNVEFGEDDGDNYTQTRRINLSINDTGFGASVSTSALPSQSSTPTTPSRLYGRDARILHYKAAQHMLQKLLPLLVKELCPGDQQLSNNLSVLTKLFWVRYCKKFHETTSPTILDLYVLIFLAMRKLNRHPVYVSDFLALIRHNKVPYINGLTLVPPAYLRQLTSTRSQLSGTSIPMNDQFHAKAASLSLVVASSDNWKTPLDYFFPGAFRVFTDLGFRDTPCLLTLFYRIGDRITGGEFPASYKQLTFQADTQYVALLLLVIKIYFASASEVPKLDDWASALKSQRSKNPAFDKMNHKLSISDALDLSAESTASYFDWIQKNLIPENRKVTDSHEVPITTRKLYKIFPLKDYPDFASENASKSRSFVPMTKNTLTTSDILSIEDQLRDHLCLQFGFKKQSLAEAYERMEKSFYKVLKSEGAIIH